MRNTKKNTGGASGKGFDVSGQPAPELKSKGWERRRQARAFMDKVMEYQDLSASEFESLARDIKEHPEKYKIRDLMAFKYSSKSFNTDKFLIDWLDRHIGKAPQQHELSGPDGESIDVNLSNYSKQELDRLTGEELLGVAGEQIRKE